MKLTKEDLIDLDYIFSDAVAEMQVESEEKGIEKGIEKGLTTTVMNLRREMGLSSEQIANITGTTVEFVQAIIDKYEQKKA